MHFNLIETTPSLIKEGVVNASFKIKKNLLLYINSKKNMLP